LPALLNQTQFLGWYWKLVAQNFDGSRKRTYPSRPRVSREVEELIVRFAKENSGWGYDRIVGALANLGHCVSDQTVGNIQERHGLGPAPKRSQTIRWKDFIASRTSVIAQSFAGGTHPASHGGVDAADGPQRD
jgi:hypothetical protein